MAEGQGCESRKEFFQFLSIAYGSLREVETQVLIAERLSYIDTAAYTALVDQCNEIGKLINGLKKSIR